MSTSSNTVDRPPAVSVELQPVVSSNIEAIGHDGAETLAVKFKNGGLFHYAGVSPVDHAAMMAAESIGKHFHANIKGKYPGTRQDVDV